MSAPGNDDGLVITWGNFTFKGLRGLTFDAIIIDDPHDPESAREIVRRETLAAHDDAHGKVP